MNIQKVTVTTISSSYSTAPVVRHEVSMPAMPEDWCTREAPARPVEWREDEARPLTIRTARPRLRAVRSGPELHMSEDLYGALMRRMAARESDAVKARADRWVTADRKEQARRAKTITAQVLAVLGDGKRRTTKQVAEAVGVPVIKASRALRDLRNRDAVQVVDRFTARREGGHMFIWQVAGGSLPALGNQEGEG